MAYKDGLVQDCLLTHWGYCSLALSHRYIETRAWSVWLFVAGAPAESSPQEEKEVSPQPRLALYIKGPAMAGVSSARQKERSSNLRKMINPRWLKKNQLLWFKS